MRLNNFKILFLPLLEINFVACSNFLVNANSKVLVKLDCNKEIIKTCDQSSFPSICKIDEYSTEGQNVCEAQNELRQLLCDLGKNNYDLTKMQCEFINSL